MASLNLSIEGPAIQRSYASVVDAPPPAGASSTLAVWAVYAVSAPLANAFQPDSGKESVLKVQSTRDLIDEFSDGRIQFAFAKVKDPNTTLPKSVLIAWCGAGVPERTKGYFTSHLNAVAKLLHGYHVQVTARTDGDLTPDGIIRKVSDASGAKYSGDTSAPAPGPPPVASKPVFKPTSTTSSFIQRGPASSGPVDNDGWGSDAPPVTRSQLEKVESAYKPTKVNMAELTQGSNGNGPEVVRGAYQPIGKVDIAAIRRQAQGPSSSDDRPTVVKGAYEPVGKVDIAAIRAKAAGSPAPPAPAPTPAEVPDRSVQERITSLPKPKVANKFGGFTGTTAPLPGDSRPAPPPQVGLASKNFADQGGKTPAQLWAEKKRAAPAPVVSQPSGGAQSTQSTWDAGYTGKKWAPVPTTRTGQSAVSGTSEEPQPESQQESQQETNISAIRDKFAAVPPPPPMASRPDFASRASEVPDEQTVNIPPPPAQPRSPSPPTPEPSSPIRIAQPVARQETVIEPPEERFSPPPVPAASIAQVAPAARDLGDEPQVAEDEVARTAGQTAAESSFGAVDNSAAAASGGLRAIVQYDYERAEDNEVELHEGEVVTNIEQVDSDWWMGTNARGESGLFPSNYVELDESAPAAPPAPAAAPAPAAPTAASKPTATAQYDYDAAEDNELSFPEGAVITDLEFPDEDWWLGTYNGSTGLFPAGYVERN